MSEGAGRISKLQRFLVQNIKIYPISKPHRLRPQQFPSFTPLSMCFTFEPRLYTTFTVFFLPAWLIRQGDDCICGESAALFCTVTENVEEKVHSGDSLAILKINLNDPTCTAGIFSAFRSPRRLPKIAATGIRQPHRFTFYKEDISTLFLRPFQMSCKLILWRTIIEN